MLPALAPILFPTGLPRRGLIAWHDLWFPNVFLHSDDLTNAAWKKPSAGEGSVGATCTVTPGQTDPLGGNTAFRVQISNGNNIGYAFVSQFNVPPISPSTVGAWLKSNTGSNQDIVSSNNANFVKKTITAEWAFYPHYVATDDGANSGWGVDHSNGVDTADFLIWHPQGYPAAALPGYVTTTTLQSIPDLSGNGNTLTRGSNASAADTNDVTILGPGMSGATDDGAKTAALSGINKDGAFSLFFTCKPSGSSGTLVSLTDSATASTKFQRVLYSASGALKIGSAAGGAESLSDPLTVDPATNQQFLLTSDGTTLTLKRMDTGTIVTVADTNPDGNTVFAWGCTGGSTMANFADAFVGLSSLVWGRAITASDAQRTRSFNKSSWAARSIAVA